ncbi:MAG: hypothetical protein KDB54_03985 [Solirubrobacterales bacterium]|nr:hypothetical protein [Solirubrobacterales bacterium]HRV59575.1 hypothetical protein [Solirubrobacterales bacterium]
MARTEGQIPDGLLTGMERQAAIRGVETDEMFESAVRSELAAYRNREPGPLADLDELRLSFDWPASDSNGRRGRRHL